MHKQQSSEDFPANVRYSNLREDVKKDLIKKAVEAMAKKRPSPQEKKLAISGMAIKRSRRGA